ncbi:MAG: hypothetical protein KG012_19485 [Deltaproteobacteria bacterium]|nr:hypothetical protein [Deltaproteobacteria bacterium]
MDWHRKVIKEACRYLETDPETEMSAEDAAKRLSRYGRNSLTERVRISPALCQAWSSGTYPLR